MNSIKRHAAEFARAYRNHKYDETDTGLYFPAQGVVTTSSVTTYVNGADPLTTHNKFTLQGRKYLFGAGLMGEAQSTGWYLAPFSGSVVVDDSWTAANFTANATEFTQYTESLRPKWDGVADPNASTGSNAASPAKITIGTGVTNHTIRGWGCLSVSAKSGTTGILLAALRNDRTSLNEADVLSAQYTIVFQDAP